NNAVYLLTQELPFKTSNGGGPPTLHKGVFKDELIMTGSNSLNIVGRNPNQSYMIGRLGAVIDGYSDDATLANEGYDVDERVEARIIRTANRVVVSLNAGASPPDTPNLHTVAASYIVNGDKDTKDIEVSSIEVLVPGEITITYRAAT